MAVSISAFPLSQQGTEKEPRAATRLVWDWALRCLERKDEMLTESCYSQYESDHNGDPGHPERLLPVALSLVGLQARAALQKTCSKTQPGSRIELFLLRRQHEHS